MLKSERAEKARQTLEYFKKGCYISGNNEINCQSRFNTEFISEQQLEALILPNDNFTPQYEVVNESVVDAVLRIGNDTADVAHIFYKLLKNEGFERHFERMTFAVYDPKGRQYGIFKKQFI